MSDVGQGDDMVGRSAPRVVIVGGGPAAANCAAHLRMADYRGSITIITDAPHLPLTVPALSKTYLKGDSTVDEILIRPASTYADQNIDVRREVRCEAIERSTRRVLLIDGTYISYDYLVLATGGRPRQLDKEKVSGGRVQYLRSVADANALKGWLHEGRRLIVIGGGYLGLEVASVARQLGAAVTVVEAMPRLLARVTSEPISDFFLRLHQENGVGIRLDTAVAGIFPSERGQTLVALSSGEHLISDLALVSIGLEPAVELADQAGLTVGDGIIVDEFCRTSDSTIFAAGDCTNHPCSENGGMRRLESFPNALEQASVVAAYITGKPVPYQVIPWFWSEQFDVILQSVGLRQSDDNVVVRGSTDTTRLISVFYLRNGCVRAADVVGSPRDFAAARKLVAKRSVVSPERLQDTTIALKQVVEDVRV